ncbi:caspase family protein [Actinomadura violacea]|uniref:Caspase family protein n=1 Tax=Actinomadura violacea TaxID=2819934 RepID=A0ABS3RKW8_9ACTN|nr:caspase family protein [Actinomadura violacea]MBO2457372.1 caspase family protein [Actinomadura violacea]
MRLHAVVIGIDAYLDPAIDDLRFARSDAESVAAMLRGSSFSDSVEVTELFDHRATRAAIMHAIGVELPRASSAGDVVLVYFAGHGSPELGAPAAPVASRYLVCHDSGYDSLLATSIDVELDLARLAARLPAALVVFVTDACFSGFSGGRGIAGPVLAARRRENRAAVRLADLRLGEGTVFLGAAADDEVAWEDPSLRHGIFTYFLRKELTSRDGGERIGLSTLYDRVHEGVSAYSRSRQNPVMHGTVKGAHLPIFR